MISQKGTKFYKIMLLIGNSYHFLKRNWDNLNHVFLIIVYAMHFQKNNNKLNKQGVRS